MANNAQGQMQTGARPPMAKQQTGKPTPGQSTNPADGKKSKVKLWIIIAVVIILIGLGLWFFLG
jgi:hypothetical protein|tara:strand:- start:3751 stop:3942 length:192 start_codon:yes stop_codon:yes gene_type:complete